MSNIEITVEKIKSIEPHPNADRLEIAKILGTQVVVQKGQFKSGDVVIYFPPDMMIPLGWSERLGVQKYLKHALWDGKKIQCRIAATRLRGIASYGFIHSQIEISNVNIGEEVTDQFLGRKYEPPPVFAVIGGDAEPDHPEFHKYTEIENYYKYPDVIKDGTPVRITEKLHGTNCRVGVVKIDEEWQFVAGSHNVRVKSETASGKPSLYWIPLQDENVLEMLNHLCNERYPVIIFAEIFGPGIQDLDYGMKEVSFRVFDISVGGQYLDWQGLKYYCDVYNISYVPLIHIGPFSPNLVEKFANGPTEMEDPENIRSKFKGREGIVITPLVEQWNEITGRVILKSVSADYLDRKGGRDNG
jgi:RNA ligase (TIGR02306 family)